MKEVKMALVKRHIVNESPTFNTECALLWLKRRLTPLLDAVN